MKKELILSYDKKQVQSRDVTREMESKHKKQVSELKCHYDKILLQNDEELYELKKFKKDSDYITGQIVYDAEVKHKRELEQRSKIQKRAIPNKNGSSEVAPKGN